MIIDCISDLHGDQPTLQGGDLLIIAGDITGRDEDKQWDEFYSWLAVQEYDQKIYIPGNHDNYLARRCNDPYFQHDLGIPEEDGFQCLCDSGTEFEGLKIWGSPWTAKFLGQSPRAMAYAIPQEALYDKWQLIPEDTNILITHSPANGILDGYAGYSASPRIRFGSNTLYARLSGLKQLKLHVFGHIHVGAGHIPFLQDFPGVQFVNAAQNTDVYEFINKPIRIEI